MTVARLQRDAEGRVIPYGRVRRELVYSGNIDGSNALPAWLTAPVGTVTYNSIATTTGGIKVATDATIGAQAQLAGPTISLTRWDEVKLTLEGLTLDDLNGQTKTEFGFGFHTSQLGAAAIQTTAAPNDRMRLFTQGTGGASYDTGYQLVGSNGKNTHNLSFLLRPARRQMWLMCDDQVVTGWAATSLNTGSLTPLVSLTTREAVSHSFSLMQLKLELTASRVFAT